MTALDDRDDVGLTIDGNNWDYWNEMEIHLSLDSHASVGFSAPFEADRKLFRDTFQPFSFKPLTVTVGGETLFTGTMVDVAPSITPERRDIAVSAYSKAAVLADCDMPAGSVPFESNGLSLRQIAERLAAPFGVSVVMGAADGSPFKRVNTKSKKIDGKADQDQKVQDFLVEIAKQRGLVLSSTKDGELLFWKSIEPGNPVARLEQGYPPMMGIAITLNAQAMFNELTGFVGTKRGQPGAKYTQRVALISGGALRSHSFRLDATERGDAVAAVAAKTGRMIGNALTVVVHVPTWRRPDGKLWEPNTTIVVRADDAMIYTDTEFLIRDVFLKSSAGELTASLGLVLPGSFSGKVPERFPWQE